MKFHIRNEYHRLELSFSICFWVIFSAGILCMVGAETLQEKINAFIIILSSAYINNMAQCYGIKDELEELKKGSI